MSTEYLLHQITTAVQRLIDARNPIYSGCKIIVQLQWILAKLDRDRMRAVKEMKCNDILIEHGSDSEIMQNAFDRKFDLTFELMVTEAQIKIYEEALRWMKDTSSLSVRWNAPSTTISLSRSGMTTTKTTKTTR